MRRLTAADSWYLYAETERVHTHVTGAVVLDPSTSPDTFDFATLRTHIEAVAPMLDGFRQRLVEIPFGIDHPLWADDSDLDLDQHLRHHRLPVPGGDAELAAFIGEFSSTQFDRGRPRWEMAYVDGLMNGRAALVARMHHAIIDGVTGVDMMAYLLSLTPEGAPMPIDDPGATPTWSPEPLPGPVSRMIGAGLSRLTQPRRPVRALRRTGTGVARAAMAILGTRRSGGTLAGPFEGPVPRGTVPSAPGGQWPSARRRSRRCGKPRPPSPSPSTTSCSGHAPWDCAGSSSPPGNRSTARSWRRCPSASTAAPSSGPT